MARVVTDGRAVCIGNRVNGRWESALALATDDVLRRQRRVDEPDVAWRWIPAWPETVFGYRVNF